MGVVSGSASLSSRLTCQREDSSSSLCSSDLALGISFPRPRPISLSLSLSLSRSLCLPPFLLFFLHVTPFHRSFPPASKISLRLLPSVVLAPHSCHCWFTRHLVRSLADFPRGCINYEFHCCDCGKRGNEEFKRIDLGYKAVLIAALSELHDRRQAAATATGAPGTSADAISFFDLRDEIVP
jgi:hypothetical protein